MKINVKCKPGDMVYVIDKTITKRGEQIWKSYGPVLVGGVKIVILDDVMKDHVRVEAPKTVYYYWKQDDHYKAVETSDKDVFLSPDLAKKECKKRNENVERYESERTAFLKQYGIIQKTHVISRD